jgi:hypothetical protein
MGFNAVNPMMDTSKSSQNNRRQVIQQIIHNNGSGNILFASSGDLNKGMRKSRTGGVAQ